MQLDDIRFLFAFDRWATTKVLDAAEGVDATTWSATNIVDERGLGGILVHHLGASQRWRHGLTGATGELPRPEDEPLPDLAALRAAVGARMGRLRRLVRRGWTPPGSTRPRRASACGRCLPTSSTTARSTDRRRRSS